MKLCALLQINQEDGDIVELGKKNLHNRHSCPGLSSVGLAVEYMQWKKLDKICKMIQRVGLC